MTDRPDGMQTGAETPGEAEVEHEVAYVPGTPENVGLDSLTTETDGLATIGSAMTTEAASNHRLEQVARLGAQEDAAAAANSWMDPAPAQVEPYKPSLWARLTGRAAKEQKLHDLNAAIASDPQASANYLFRGEWYLQQRDYAAAEQDLQQALDLASTDVHTSRWGLTAQTIQDRAVAGLQDARAHL